MKASPKGSTIPLAPDAAVIRGELNSPNPVVALSVALVAFHALTKKQLSELRLTDISDGHLVLGNRDIPLAGPVRTAWQPGSTSATGPGQAVPTRTCSSTGVRRPGSCPSVGSSPGPD
jgi:hypothetical protein